MNPEVLAWPPRVKGTAKSGVDAGRRLSTLSSSAAVPRGVPLGAAGSQKGSLAAVTWGRASLCFNLSIHPSVGTSSCQVADSKEMEAALSPLTNVATAALPRLST